MRSLSLLALALVAVCLLVLPVSAGGHGYSAAFSSQSYGYGAVYAAPLYVQPLVGAYSAPSCAASYCAPSYTAPLAPLVAPAPLVSVAPYVAPSLSVVTPSYGYRQSFSQGYRQNFSAGYGAGSANVVVVRQRPVVQAVRVVSAPVRAVGSFVAPARVVERRQVIVGDSGVRVRTRAVQVRIGR